MPQANARGGGGGCVPTHSHSTVRWYWRLGAASYVRRHARAPCLAFRKRKDGGLVMLLRRRRWRRQLLQDVDQDGLCRAVFCAHGDLCIATSHSMA